MSGMQTDHVIWVPAVSPLASESETADVQLARASTDPADRPKAVRCEIEDIGKLCAAEVTGFDARRGETAGTAYLVPAHERLAPDLIRGRSMALGLALAALRAYEGRRLRAPVVATGDLTIAAPGVIACVGWLAVKLRGAAQRLRERQAGRAIALFPAAQLPDGAAPAAERLAPDDLPALERDFPEVTFRPVATLVDAANEVFDLAPGERFQPAVDIELRNRIESLRYDVKRVEELFAACRELYERAGSMPPPSERRIVARYHALSNAAFALRYMGSALRSWPGHGSPSPAHQLGAKLAAEARAIGASQAICDELRAEHLNLCATEGFRSLTFTEHLELADAGLGLRGLVEGHHSEHRKLLGTRGQLRWRMALRNLSVPGMRADARESARLALRDIRNALAAARAKGVEEPNDLSRVRTYLCTAALVAERVGLEGVRAADEWPEHGPVLLGPAWDGAQRQPPPQEPSWALDAWYGHHAVRGAWGEIVGHWRACADRPLGGEWGEGTLATLLATAPPQTGWPFLAPTLAEAALAVGDDDLLAAALVRFPAELTLAGVAAWWPVTRCPSTPPSTLAAAARLRTWAQTAEDGALPQAARGDADILGLLRALAAPGADLAAEEATRRRLLLWCGKPAPFDHVAPTTAGCARRRAA